MQRGRALALAVLASASSIALAQAPEATSLTLGTVEHGPWPNAVAALQADRASEGRAVHVFVLDDLGRRAPCGSYVLNFDAQGAAAFRVLSCDPRDGTTAVQLLSRTALFSHEGPFSRPRAMYVTATEVRTGAAAGGAALTGGSALSCSVRVRPYVDDLEHGGHVYLTPDRYAVRVTAAGVNVQAGSAGWLLTSGTRAQLDVDYDVVDRGTNEVVLHDRATLACSSGTPARAAPGPVLGPSVSAVRGAAQIDGVGLPLSEFDDELPRDATTEQPSAYVRSRVVPAGGSRAEIPILSLPDDAVVLGTLTVQASTSTDALAQLRAEARRMGADALSPPRMQPLGGGLRGTALAFRFGR